VVPGGLVGGEPPQGNVSKSQEAEGIVMLEAGGHGHPERQLLVLSVHPPVLLPV
jgi:hypothetical protein